MSKSKIFLYLVLSFILGTSLASFYNFLPLYAYFILLSISLIVVFVWRKEKIFMLIGLCCLFFIIGNLRFLLALPKNDEDIIKTYNDKEEIEFQGVISDEPDIREDKIKLTVNSRQININKSWKDISGKALVDVDRFPEYQYGDYLKITCKLQTPAVFESFSYKDYLAKSNIYSVCYNANVELLEKEQGSYILSALYKAKDKFKKTISDVLVEPQASLLQGILLGMKQGIPEEIKEYFSMTGTSHVIVISGLHITIVAGILIYLGQLLSLPRKYALILAILGLVIFILLIGAKPSAIRAGIMGGLVILAMHSGRLTDIKNAILCAAAIIILINPKVLRFDVGFQLSFLATIGIVYLSPYVQKIIKFIPEHFKIKDIVAMTLSAQILTMPLIIYNFKSISLISPLVNVLIVPFIPVTIISGLVTIFLGMMWLLLGKIAAIITYFLLQYEIYVVSLFAKIPLASVQVDNLWYGWIIIYYFFIVYVIYYLRRREKLFL